MRDQYAGDLSDYLKFALLRVLAGDGRRLGIAWYYNNQVINRESDGQHLEWRENLAWRALDTELFDSLRMLPVRSVEALERANFWPQGTIFHGEAVPSRSQRAQWGAQMRASLADANLIFVDPDNGLGASPKKHATYEEMREFRSPKRVLVSIKFPGMVDHKSQLHDLHERLKLETGTSSGFTILTNASVPRKSDPRFFVQRPRWFSIIDGDALLLDKATRYVTALSSLPRASARIVAFGQH